jgi:sulfatase modifying factor 1
MKLQALVVVGVATLATPALAVASASGRTAEVPKHSGPVVPGLRQVGPLGYAMRLIPPGDFEMGAPWAETLRDASEAPHTVTLSDPFWMGETEIPQGLWAQVMGSNPVATRCAAYRGERFVGPALPEMCVDWCEAVAFANALSLREGLEPAYDGVTWCAESASTSVTWERASNGYRLPTEAEWERAARAGQQERYIDGTDAAGVCAYGNVADRVTRNAFPDWWIDTMPCSDGAVGPTPAGRYAANAWGIHDMVGNVWEWTWDWKEAFGWQPLIDPRGPPDGDARVLRGGAWDSAPRVVRVASRDERAVDARDSNVGLRLVRTAR